MMESQIKFNYEKIQKNPNQIRQLYSQSMRRFRESWYINSLITRLKMKDHLWWKKDFFRHFSVPGYLYGQPYVLKDNVSTKNIRTTCGSAFLKHYIPPYNATIYDLLAGVGGVLVGKANMDEFAMGGTGTFSAYGIVHNPLSYESIAGGSSSGSAAAVALGAVPYAIGNDTGDSIRKPASYVGVVGFKPSYGFISRYGVIPFAPSLDHVGVFARYVTDVSLVCQVIVRYDEKDFTSVKAPVKFKDTLTFKPKLTLGYLGCLESLMTEQLLGKWNLFKQICVDHQIELVKLDVNYHYLKSIGAVYSIISCAEAASCYASFTGVTFGENVQGTSFDDELTKARTKFLGKQVKRRFLIGSYATSNKNFERLFLKSKKVRRLIVNDYIRYLPPYGSDQKPTVDAIVSLGAGNVAPPIISVRFDASASISLIDDYLQVANFSGMPSITIPFVSIGKLPLGINLMNGYANDVELLDIAYTLERIFSDWRENK